MSGQVVDTETGELVETCSAEEARELTDRIKAHADALWQLLLDAHDRRAWQALGYATWADYVAGEFDRSKQWSYQLLDQGRAIKAIEEATGSNAFDLSINEARDVKPHLEEVSEHVRCAVAEETTDDEQPDDDRVREIVTETVDRYRGVTQREDDAREVMQDVDPERVPKQDPERVRQERAVINAVSALAEVPDPYRLAQQWSPHALYHLDRLHEARRSLDALDEGRKDGAQ